MFDLLLSFCPNTTSSSCGVAALTGIVGAVLPVHVLHDHLSSLCKTSNRLREKIHRQQSHIPHPHIPHPHTQIRAHLLTLFILDGLDLWLLGSRRHPLSVWCGLSLPLTLFVSVSLRGCACLFVCACLFLFFFCSSCLLVCLLGGKK